MITHLTDTSASAVDKKLIAMRESGGVVAVGRVLTLLILAEPDQLDEPLQAAVRASHEHPCRVLVLVVEPEAEADGLDAEIRVGSDAGAGEIVVLNARGQVVTGLDTLITPLLLPDAPIVAWWPGTPPSCPSQDVLGSLSQRRITDARASQDPGATLKRLRRGYRSGDSDLAWSRLTSWRGLVASAFEIPPMGIPSSVVVKGVADEPSVILMAAWLEHSLGLEVTVQEGDPEEPGISAVILNREDGAVELHRLDGETIAMNLPGDKTDQHITVPRRSLYECLSEELRRIDPDEVYGDVLRHAFTAVEDVSAYAVGKPASTDVVAADPVELASTAAEAIADKLETALSERGIARLVLTGGSIGIRTAGALADALLARSFDVSRLEVWWGDERFVASGSPDRNDEAVRAGFLDKLDVPDQQVHRMPSTGSGMGLDDSAAWYGQQLDLAGGDAPFRTHGSAFFDVLLLGVGPDGHIASLFPEHDDQREGSLTVIPVRDSPKPPPDRISLTWPTLNSARHVMLLVAGAEKAEAVERGHSGIDPWGCPASAVRGLASTTWYLDEAASAQL